MTSKKLFTIAALLFGAGSALFIAGLMSANAALPLLSILCVVPLFGFFLGGAVFKFSGDFQIVPKNQAGTRQQQLIRPGAARPPEVLS